MKLIEHIHLLSRLDYLIRRKATGTPRHLAQRLNISERHVYRLINELKIIGFPVEYNRNRDSYCYEGDVSIHFKIKINHNEIINVQGG